MVRRRNLGILGPHSVDFHVEQQSTSKDAIWTSKDAIWFQAIWAYSFDNSYIVSEQGFGREKDGNHGKFIGSNLVIFCYKEFGKSSLCKSVSQLEALFIVYSEPIESEQLKFNFS